MSKDIKLTKNYMQFQKGDVFVVNSDVRANSVEIIHNGRKYDIPNSNFQYMSGVPTAAAPMSNPGGQLSGLMGAQPTGVTAPVAPASPTPAVPKMSLKDNEVFMSHFTHGVLPSSGVDHVITMFPSDTWSEEHHVHIPEFNPNYHWNANVLECLVLGLDESERVLLVGMPGTGKTTAHEQFASIIGQPFMPVNGKDGMEPSSYLGSVAPDGTGGWAWSDGTLPQCMKDGYYLCVDEVFKIAAGINMAMQSVWQRGGKLVLDDKPGSLLDKLVVPDDKFQLMATDNVKGLGDSFSMFSGTQMQDTSTLDRFDTTFTVPYMPERVEATLLSKMYPEVDEDIIDKLVQVAGLIRKGYAAEEISLTFSMRGLMATCRKLTRKLNVKDAFKYSFLEKLADEQEIEAVNEFVKTCGLNTSSSIKNPSNPSGFKW